MVVQNADLCWEALSTASEYVPAPTDNLLLPFRLLFVTLLMRLFRAARRDRPRGANHTRHLLAHEAARAPLLGPRHALDGARLLHQRRVQPRRHARRHETVVARELGAGDRHRRRAPDVVRRVAEVSGYCVFAGPAKPAEAPCQAGRVDRRERPPRWESAGRPRAFLARMISSKRRVDGSEAGLVLRSWMNSLKAAAQVDEHSRLPKGK